MSIKVEWVHNLFDFLFASIFFLVVYFRVAFHYQSSTANFPRATFYDCRNDRDWDNSAIVPAPECFTDCVKAALLAPAAMNRQKFYFTPIDSNKVKATTKGGFYIETDLGIAKYFFETGAGGINFEWTK